MWVCCTKLCTFIYSIVINGLWKNISRLNDFIPFLFFFFFMIIGKWISFLLAISTEKFVNPRYISFALSRRIKCVSQLHYWVFRVSVILTSVFSEMSRRKQENFLYRYKARCTRVCDLAYLSNVSASVYLVWPNDLSVNCELHVNIFIENWGTMNKRIAIVAPYALRIY